jgi:hypothetical protein
MGKILAMTPRLMVCLAMIGWSVAGCAMLPKAQGMVGKLSGLSGTQASPVEHPKDAPTMEVILRTKGTSLTLVALDRDQDIVLWSSRLGAQIALRDGVVVSTRGLGGDLMSALAPTLAEISAAPAEYARLYEFLDGADDMQRKSYNCTTENKLVGEGESKLRQVVETCISQDRRSISNEYVFAADNRLVVSKQWVTSSVGYAEISHISQEN